MDPHLGGRGAVQPLQSHDGPAATAGPCGEAATTHGVLT
jgi:hypothetical protein